MKRWVALVLTLLVACTKNTDVAYEKEDVTAQNDKPLSCNFGIETFNQTKRAPVSNADAYRGKPPKTTNTGTAASVIFLDFDGQLISGTSWNTNGDFYCAPANLTSTDISRIVDR